MIQAVSRPTQRIIYHMLPSSGVHSMCRYSAWRIYRILQAYPLRSIEMKNFFWRACRMALLLFILLNYLFLSAQKEPSIWLFGDHNGIDFRSGAPVAISNPNISYHGAEVSGVATVTDANGNLLFYAENETVYNSQHDTMLNGAELRSNWSAKQTFLTVRAIRDTTLYYLFTVDMYSVGGESYSSADLWYSVVDMKADNGLGAVTAKNVPLLTNSTTQIGVVRHCNERDIWIIAHEWESDAYYAYLVSQEGVSATPVISRSGRRAERGSFGPMDLYGFIKASPDGKKIAASYMKMGVDLSDFDNATGVVSNSINLNLTSVSRALIGGVEFSSGSGLLYANYLINASRYLVQYNLDAGSPAAVIASKTEIASTNAHGYIDGMQRRQDGKIYVAYYGEPYVAIIHQPDVLGIGCNFEWDALQLGRRSSHNFPAYMESRYYPEPSFTFSVVCPANRVRFNYDESANIISVKWDFGDPASGSANTSVELNPVHEFTEEGEYLVKLVLFTACDTDTLEEKVSVKKISVDLGNDTAVCTNAGYLLEPAAASALDYLWQDGSTNHSLLAEDSGIYWLEITDPSSGCSERDSIMLDIRAQPEFTLGPDRQVCDAAIQLATPASGSSYLWNTGSADGTISISASGLYWLQVNNGKCFYRDSIEINFVALSVDLGPDTAICEGEEIILGGQLQNGYSYVWEDGSVSPIRRVHQPGTFTITATNECGSVSDDIVVRPGGCLLAVPNAFTPNGDGKNDVFSIGRTSPLSKFIMQVFNRWGQKVFESRDQSQGWNGSIGGKLCDMGHYAYVIQYSNADGAPVTLKGMVMLIR